MNKLNAKKLEIISIKTMQRHGKTYNISISFKDICTKHKLDFKLLSKKAKSISSSVLRLFSNIYILNVSYCSH